MTKKRVLITLALLYACVIVTNAQKLKADDQLAIRNAVSQWNQLQDDGNIIAFIDLWTDRANFTNPFGKFSGKEEIQKFTESYVSGFAKGKRHESTNLTISGNGSIATIIEDLNVVEVNEIPYIVATVRFTATMVKEKDIWKFSSVKLEIDPGFIKLQEKMKKE